MKIEERLAALNECYRDADSGSSGLDLAPLRKALGDRSNLMAARAAEIGTRLRCETIIPDLLTNFDRFLTKNPGKIIDKGCWAKNAMIKALYELDHLDADFYRSLLGYQQREPVWGTTEDTAMVVRETSAFGLAASNDPRSLVDLVPLLHDAEPSVRMAAIQAIGTLHSSGVEAVLRQKAISGDPEPQVLDECFRTLLHLEPDHSIPFVAEFLRHPSSIVIGEFAALALGETRQPAALDVLLGEFEGVSPSISSTVLIRAIGLARIEPAIEFLLNLLANDSGAEKVAARDALAAYEHVSAVAERLAEIEATPQ
ncbi:MAG: HEAT repeat domain-containing protein [Verrucomicrobiota bacterium]